MVYLAKNIVNKRTVSFFAKIVGSHLKYLLPIGALDYLLEHCPKIKTFAETLDLVHVTDLIVHWI